MTVDLIQGLLLAFALVVILMPPYIRLLKYTGFGKQIRREGPETHYVKEGTPTMGGLLVILIVIAVYLRPSRPARRASPFRRSRRSPSSGSSGRVDDWLNARTGEGISARQKLLWQVVVRGLLRPGRSSRPMAVDGISVPFVGTVTIDPVVWVAFAAFAIVASSNGVNITDGLDGLAGGTLIFAFVSFLIIAVLNVRRHQPNLAFLCALIIGGLLGFLWFNVHPAQVFMGDAGSLAFGATLAVMALITGQILVLPLIGIIFVARDAALGHPPGRRTSRRPAASACSG